jgi:hypothetical protein
MPLLCRSPAAALLRWASLVTLNSDDPAFFGSDLANEYLLAHTEQGFTRNELRQLAANSIRASFLPEERNRCGWRVLTRPSKSTICAVRNPLACVPCEKDLRYQVDYPLPFFRAQDSGHFAADAAQTSPGVKMQTKSTK